MIPPAREADDVACHAGTLRRVESDLFELYNGAGQIVQACAPGDTMYIEPYLYTCNGQGRWQRSAVPMR